MTAITDIRARRIWDSRGRPTIEVDVLLADRTTGRGVAPAGASTGSGEACDLRDGGSRLGGLDVLRAVGHVNGEIRTLLVGSDVEEQAGLDQKMIDADATPDKSRLGGNALIATSLAILNARANAAALPLWALLHDDSRVAIPVPEIQIFGGGAHAQGRCDLQDYMAVPLGATNFSQALEWVAEVYYAAGRRLAQQGRLQGVADEGGYWPAFSRNEEGIEALTRAIEGAGFVAGRDVAIALDAAATRWRKDGVYHWGLDRQTWSVDTLLDEYGRWLDRYAIVSIEDPFAEDDEEGMRAFTQRFGDRIQVVGDDYLVTSAPRIERAAGRRECNTVLIKPNQAGTVTETYAALMAARRAGYRVILSARSGETEDITLVDLAVGWQADVLKVGSFSRSERMAKWNQMLRIEEALGSRAVYRGTSSYRSDSLSAR
jgi:enolase